MAKLVYRSAYKVSHSRMTRITRAAARRNLQVASAAQIKRSRSSSDVGGKAMRIKKDIELDATEISLSPSSRKKTSGPLTKDTQSKKLSSFSKFHNQTPFPDFLHPTPAECKEVHRILSSLHGERNRPKEVVAPSGRSGCGDSPSVLDALVRTILSQNTSDINSTRAKLNMDKVYGRSDKWKVIHEGGQAKLKEAIKCGGLSAVKSKVILNILDQVHKKYNTYSLDHLHSATSEEAMQEMLSFPGVGFKTASCVLLFCLQRESFAVDTHVWRITGLLGWRPPSASRDETFRHLDVRIPNEDKYGLHILLVTHGKRCEECKAGGKVMGNCELRKAFKKGTRKTKVESSGGMKLEIDEAKADRMAKDEMKEVKKENENEVFMFTADEATPVEVKDEAKTSKIKLKVEDCVDAALTD